MNTTTDPTEEKIPPKHSTAPWEHRYNEILNEHYVADSTGERIITPTGDIIHEEADMHLVAAAPDLQKSLRDIVSFLSKDGYNDDPIGLLSLVVKAKATLAKSKGQPS